MLTWSVYLVRCADGALYTGIATDVARRLQEHEQARKGAKYLRGRGPLELALQQSVGARSLALRVEARIKKLPKSAKERLVEDGELGPVVACARRELKGGPRGRD